MDQVMESTNGDAVVVGEIVIQQRREVVVPKDPGLQGLDDHQSSSDDTDTDTDAGAGMDMKSSTNGNGHHVSKSVKENFGKSVYFDEDAGTFVFLNLMVYSCLVIIMDIRLISCM